MPMVDGNLWIESLNKSWIKYKEVARKEKELIQEKLIYEEQIFEEELKKL